MREAEDQRLVEAIGRRDPDALRAAYLSYGRLVYHLLLAQGADAETAEDLTQDVFLALVEQPPRRIRNLQAYLCGIARHKARRHSTLRAKECTLGDEAPEAATGTGDGELVALDALRALSREQAEVVVLKVWHELTFAEIGELLHVSPNTAAGRYRYGMERLRRVWDESESVI